ncbi:hypothetical protein DPMN_069098 [Dreissena polymorpha]|uniref:Uncharacterized protein n=1 Tax=Dreissena polymorpha TaxID=45954 RepID=A0A9D3Y5G4_DREPO|nr:hypothetical protein DPMN_081544 [Dreissena polymorpha]KAH3694168.1 hypothetical protein DPMN_081607 [Dreissena polymorpha]KAH3694228.1 hypothetical protein DPMN_081668 [Dreissena polymorpha]KAH3709634.1 hypothetical protein DPMN_069098 [Dreissena polymorpha]
MSEIGPRLSCHHQWEEEPHSCPIVCATSAPRPQFLPSARLGLGAHGHKRSASGNQMTKNQ